MVPGIDQFFGQGQGGHVILQPVVTVTVGDDYGPVAVCSGEQPPLDL